jgi:fructose-1,6-bisphosphatase/inositol monophosphatase family enzyme
MPPFGSLTPQAVEMIIIELMRRVMKMIWENRFSFNILEKENLYKRAKDVVTSADHRAQEMYVKSFMECFPEWGIIAEEENLRKQSQNGIWITIDPLDGTRSFIRQQSNGVGTMVSVLVNGEVWMAFVGDILTQEVYCFRKDSLNTWQIQDFKIPRKLSYVARPIKQCYCLLDRPLDSYSPALQKLTKAFREHQISSGGIGVRFTRLWNGEFGALMMKFKYYTAWDLCPVYGISTHLGYQFFEMSANEKKLLPYVFRFEIEPYEVGKELVVLHPEFYALLSS